MYYKNDSIQSRPKIPVSNPKESHYRKFGWIPFRHDIPEFDSETQRIEKSEIIETETEAVQTYSVQDLTEQEIEERKSEVQKLREELYSEIDRIAGLIETGARGQELANLIRNK